MAPSDDIALRDATLSASDEQSLPPTDEETPNMTGADAPQRASRAKMAGVLVGAAISQLPMWGFFMNYGVFQEYYTSHWTLSGSRDLTGIIGTTANGVIYLSMPFLFALFARRLAAHRRAAALAGALLLSGAFLLSSFSTAVWQLVATQGVLAALGCALLYSPTTLSLGECFGGRHRTLAYGVTLSCKNIVGSTCPILLRALLTRYGLRSTLRIWAGLTLATSILAIALVATPASSVRANRPRALPWSFLRHRAFHVHAAAIALQGAGYGIPQTYLAAYAAETALVSQASATLLIVLFNLPGIVSSSLFGYLGDGARVSFAPGTIAAVSAGASALSAWLLWGLAARGALAQLVLFAVSFGFFAGGYSATWGGVVGELEADAAARNEAIDGGLVYGLLNGARGLGFVTGGLASVPLLKAGAVLAGSRFAYGSAYGPLIVFTGLSTVFGGLGVLRRGRALLRFV